METECKFLSSNSTYRIYTNNVIIVTLCAVGKTLGSFVVFFWLKIPLDRSSIKWNLPLMTSASEFPLDDFLSLNEQIGEDSISQACQLNSDSSWNKSHTSHARLWGTEDEHFTRLVAQSFRKVDDIVAVRAETVVWCFPCGRS